VTNINIYSPGQDVTGQASATLTAKRAVKISGNRTGGNVAVAPADAAGRIFGIAKDDTASGDLVSVARAGVVKVTAGGSIAAFAEVEVGTAGKVITKASGVAIGYALTAATTDTDAEISLY
jgi:hypothetical protein